MIRFQSFLSGSSGNATYVTDGTVHLLVDCGAGGKYIESCLERISVQPKELSAILITHEHRDHVMGAGILSRRYDIPIYATKKTWTALGDSLGKISEKNKRYTEKKMCFGNLLVSSFKISHDGKDPVGYSFICEDEKFTIATDFGCVTEEVLSALLGSFAVIIEANHDEEMLKKGRYPYPLKKRILGEKGHLSNADCGRLCAKLYNHGTRSFWLGHLSVENNKPDLAYKTVYDCLLENLEEEKKEGDIHTMLNVLPRFWIE